MTLTLLKTWYMDRAEEGIFLSLWHSFVCLPATVEPVLVSLLVTSWSLCFTISYRGLFLWIVGLSKSFWGVKTVQVAQTATKRAKSVSFRTPVRPAAQSEKCILHPLFTVFRSQNSSISRLSLRRPKASFNGKPAGRMPETWDHQKCISQRVGNPKRGE